MFQFSRGQVIFIGFLSYYVLVYSDLKKNIEDSYTPTPLVVKLDEMYDVREWLGVSKMQGHSGPLCFEFSTGRDGTVMRYRDRSTDPWKVVQGEVLEVRKWYVTFHKKLNDVGWSLVDRALINR